MILNATDCFGGIHIHVGETINDDRIGKQAEKETSQFSQENACEGPQRLEQKLLSIGGSSVVWQGNDPHAALLVARGELFSQRVRMRRGEPHQCHANAAEIWSGDIDKYQLVTGYALCEHLWLSHSWIVQGKTLYETTTRFDRYFGVVLEPLVACMFWVGNCYLPSFPNNDAPSDFMKRHKGVLALTQRMREMPPDELSQLLTTYSQGRLG